MKIGIVAGMVLTGLSLACAVTAADNPKVTLDVSNVPISDAMAQVTKQCDVQIICGADVKKSITGHFESIELDKLMDTITKTNSLSWQKVYLPSQGDQKPIAEQIKAHADAVTAVTGGSIIVCDPTTGKQKVFVEQDSTSPSVAPEKLGMKAVYLIYKPVVTAAKTEQQQPQQTQQDVVSQFTSLQNSRMQLLSQMTPEQRVDAMRQEMQTMRDTFRTMREQGLLPADQNWRSGNQNGQGRRWQRNQSQQQGQ